MEAALSLTMMKKMKTVIAVFIGHYDKVKSRKDLINKNRRDTTMLTRVVLFKPLLFYKCDSWFVILNRMTVSVSQYNDGLRVAV